MPPKTLRQTHHRSGNLYRQFCELLNTENLTQRHGSDLDHNTILAKIYYSVAQSHLVIILSQLFQKISKFF